MSRAPWREPLRRGWFLSRASYRRYALRESSALFVALIGVDLCVASLALAAGPEAVAGWWRAHQHPAGIVLSVVTAAMVAVHALTWAAILPTVIPPRRLWSSLLRRDSPRPRPDHHEPFRWGLFGAGGSLAAMLLPVTVAVPLLAVLGASVESTVPSFLSSWSGLLAVGVVGPLLLWHGAHRIFHGLHDLQIQRGALAWAATYGLALSLAVVTWLGLVVAAW